MPGLQEGLAIVVAALIWVVLPTAFLVFVIYALVRYFTRPSTRRTDGDGDPLAILRERYARGEIDDEEYERRRTILTR